MAGVSPILNVSAYRFVTLGDLPKLRDRLFAHAQRLGLKGTVLLAEEGINLFLAGEAAAVHEWLDALRGDARFAGLQAKESVSDTVPFKRLLVKIKREIIRMNMPALRPMSGAKLSASRRIASTGRASLSCESFSCRSCARRSLSRAGDARPTSTLD